MTQQEDPAGEVSAYVFDAVNNLVSMIDRNGRITENIYDDFDRLVGEVWHDANGNIVNEINYDYDKSSNLLAVDDYFSALTYTYDDHDRALTEHNAGTPSAPQVVFTYGYDDVGNLRSVTDEASGSTTLTDFEYDALNRLSKLEQSGANVAERRVDFEYNQLGQFSSIERFRDLAGSQPVVQSSFLYDSVDRLIDLRHQSGGQDLAFYALTYDADSRVSTIDDLDGLTGFDYDRRDQLRVADRDVADVRGDEAYEFDANKNRVSSHTHGTGYATGPANELLSDGTYDYQYDKEGNLALRTDVTTGESREFVWDHRNRLAEVVDRDNAGNEMHRIRFTYDVLNRRIAQTFAGATSTTTHFAYVGMDVWLDYIDADGNGPQASELAVRYLHGPGIDNVLAQETAAGLQWLLADNLGTIRDVVDNNGNVLNHIVYDSFGNIIDQSNPNFATRFGFTGREFDLATGLHYYRARYYDAAVGRFLARDPLGFADGANSYAYVGNRATGARDPLGLHFTDAELAYFRENPMAMFDRNTLPFWQRVSDFTAGFGDSLTSSTGIMDDVKQVYLGIEPESQSLTQWIRQKTGSDEAVNYCSPAYNAGQIAGIGYQLTNVALSLKSLLKHAPQALDDFLYKVSEFRRNRAAARELAKKKAHAHDYARRLIEEWRNPTPKPPSIYPYVVDTGMAGRGTVLRNKLPWLTN